MTSQGTQIKYENTNGILHSRKSATSAALTSENIGH
jgi:hypothetical protein